MERLTTLSSACSLALFPVTVIGGFRAFLILVAINFVVFHAIWLIPRSQGFVLTKPFTRAKMIVPLILFMVCGNAVLVARGPFTPG